ncbi:hypothetical protein K501DRAFT_168676, partial [Backusella circina FSU 941]
QINEAHLATKVIKPMLIEFSYQHDIDPITHHEARFPGPTVTHFFVLITSPNNPLCTTILERTAAARIIIYIIHPLFLSNNDIVELAWFEREYATTGKPKWDGALFKIRERDESVALLEFSDEFKDQTCTIKEKEKKKLYTKVLKMINDTEPISKLIRYYANVLYFEKPGGYRCSMIKNIVTSFVAPSTLRLVKKYAQQVPDLLGKMT